MKNNSLSTNQDLWRTLVSREHGLATTRRIFEESLAKAELGLVRAEEQVSDLRETLATEVKATCAERNARELEFAAKEQTKALLAQEHAAGNRWKQLCHAAEAQIEAERSARKLEMAAKQRFELLLKDEIEARKRQEQLCIQAENQVAADRAVLKLEIAAKEQTKALLAQEHAAGNRWKQLCHAAEAQIEAERAARKLELAAKQRFELLLKDEIEARKRQEQLCIQAENQVAADRAALKLEIAAKEQTKALLAQEHAAGNRWEQLCHAAEAQIEAERAARLLEMAAHTKLEEVLQIETSAHRASRMLVVDAERQRDQERAARVMEATAKEKAVAWARAEKTANEKLQLAALDACSEYDRLAKVSTDLLQQLDEAREELKLREESLQHQTRLADQHAEALAILQAESVSMLSAASARIVQIEFTRELEAEQQRLERIRHTWLGRWLAGQNALARLFRRIYCGLRGKDFVPKADSPGPKAAQINTHDLIGGAERTSYDLHLQFRQLGLKPSLIVGGKHGHDDDVFKIPFHPIDWKPAQVWRDRWGLTEILYPTPVLGCFKWPQLRKAHVVHIHNMHGQYWSSAALLPLGMQHPLVLTLHDEYTLSGDCCYTYDCGRWAKSCGKCPQIGLNRAARYSLGAKDLTRLNMQIKRALFRAPRAYPLVIVTPTRWLAERARRSPNLRHLPIVSINNGVDHNYWNPLPQSQARLALGLPDGKCIGLLVASDLSDRRKGFDVALEAIRRLPTNTNLLFVLVGNISEHTKASLAGLPVIATGYVGEKIKMLNLFSAADFTFAMSRVDNLPYMCVESLACGRPVFGSNVGGIPEIVNEPDLGWLTAQPFDIKQICQTLLEISHESPTTRNRRFAACRRSAVTRFSLQLMTQRYLCLYQEIKDAARESRSINLSVLASAAMP